MLPQSFLDRMQKLLGEEYEAFLAAYEQEKYQALRLNALKKNANGKSAAELLGVLHNSAGGMNGSVSQTDSRKIAWEPDTGFAHLSRVPWAENGYYYEASDQPGKHPYHEAGVYYIQEPSAMAPAELLEVQPGERVLDLCAAPGGKSTQIAAKLNGEGFLLCNEINPARAKILAENVERLGIVNAYVTNETPKHLAEVFPEYFDRILVDAPCSGEGMFRKNEAACEEWSTEGIALCAERQDGILDCAARMLKPGGRLVYSTCTFAPEENEGSISRFLERWPEFRLIPIEKEGLGLTGCDGSEAYLNDNLRQMPEWQRNASQQRQEQQWNSSQSAADCLEYTLRLWPQKIKGEGHFAAVLQKAGELPEGYLSSSLNGYVTGVSDKELGEYPQFCRETFGEKELPLGQHRQATYIKFGDHIYLVSSQMPSVKGLKVLRPGLHIGTLKKSRFEPSHALALALSPKTVKYIWNLDSGENTVRAYLNGQTFPAEGEKGWYLICVDGFSIGWGKLAGGIMKNHYPRGLRINMR